MYSNRIKVTNTAIIIDNYELGESEKLEHPFKIYDPLTHKTTIKGLYYDKENKKLYLPAGIDLWFVRKALDEKYYDRIDNSKFENISNIGMRSKPRDKEQFESLKFMCAIDEYEDNRYLSQLSLNLNTGKGKTYCCIATICFFKIKSIIITGSNTLLDQWGKSILEHTNLNKNDIISINGSEYCNMILNGSSKKAANGKIFLCSHGTLRSFGDRYGWDKVNELFTKLGIGLKFYDEAHTNFDNMLMIDFFTNTYKTYYVTATPGRSDWRENHIFQISLKNVPSIDLFDENNDPHTSYIAIKWNSNPTPQQISACRSRTYGMDRNKYMDYLSKKPEFYEMMKIVMDMVKKCNGKVLMYIGTNDAILRAYYWICNNYPEFIGEVGIFTSLLSKEQKMIEREKRIILSTTKSAGLGEDIKGLKMTIVVNEPFKSDIIARQTLGRTRDNNTLYIELVDMAFVYCRRYYNAKLPVFNKYALDVSDTVIDSYELKRRVEVISQSRNIYQRSAIQLDDKRFDFSKILPKSKNENNKPKKAVSFVNKSDINLSNF